MRTITYFKGAPFYNAWPPPPKSQLRRIPTESFCYIDADKETTPMNPESPLSTTALVASITSLLW